MKMNLRASSGKSFVPAEAGIEIERLNEALPPVQQSTVFWGFIQGIHAGHVCGKSFPISPRSPQATRRVRANPPVADATFVIRLLSNKQEYSQGKRTEYIRQANFDLSTTR